MVSLIYGLTSGGILFLAFLILTIPRRVNHLGNKWMGFFLITIFFLLIDECLYSNHVMQEYPHLLGLESIFVFAIAPSIYLSVSHFVSPTKKFRKIEFLHFLPTILFLPFFILTVFQSKEEKLKFINSTDSFVAEPSDFIISYVLWLQMGIYIYFSFKKIGKHQKNIDLFSANTSNINLNWLKYFLVGISGLVILWIIDFHVFTEKATLAPALGYLSGVFFLGYYAIRQEEIFPFEDSVNLEIKEIIDSPSEEVKTLRISNEELQDTKNKLFHLMENEKLFLDETLSLPKLAERMGISVHNVSYVLNIGFSENFFQFVNKYRVNEAKEILTSPKHAHLNMVGIAFESGFSSKTTFNTTFKKIVGISPTEYVAAYSKEKNA